MFGGEYALKQGNEYSYLTDSGRSSLRLILRSGFKDKKFLVPDFICPTIIEVLNQENVAYDFYNVGTDLTINLSSIRNKDFDAIYVIHYFGNKHTNLEQINLDNKFFIADHVFSPHFEKPKNLTDWIGFNSLRKISCIADGSLLRSTVSLNDSLINKTEAPFVGLKYEAKNAKFEMLQNQDFSQDQEVFKLSQEAEDALNRQTEIYQISSRSLSLTYQFFKNLNEEEKIRAENYSELEKILTLKCTGADTDFYSFFNLKVNKRDELRKWLFDRQIYLPVFWPGVPGLTHELFPSIISIPIDSRYNINDMRRVAESILEFYK
ncbi:MAG: hypothetical protein PHV30_07110 [Candidatus Margulisbacteria bacterium]|nr:hypothetical protein [Candidatus Margulisiibacteriota bacterium]